MGISEAQKQNIDNVMNIISQICSTNDLNGCTIQYDLDSVVNTDGIFNVSLDLMNTVIFYLLFRERKSVIYSKIFKFLLGFLQFKKRMNLIYVDILIGVFVLFLAFIKNNVKIMKVVFINFIK